MTGDLSFVMINWYNAALFYLNQGDFLRNHHIRSVQAVAVLSIVFNNIKDTNFQESLLASAIRIGQALNLDQDSANIHETFIQRETRQRAWWTLIICEWLATPRRPSCISELDFDVALPSVATDDEIFREEIRLQYPERQPRSIQYHIAMAKSALVYHRFNSLLRLSQWDTSHMTSAVIDADQELAYIIDDLPSHLQADEVQTWKTDQRDLQHPWIPWQKASLSTVLLYYRSVINRTLQPHWLKGENVQARTSSICLSSAQAIISNLRTGFVKKSRWRPWAITFKGFSAALTLIREMKKSEETNASHAEIEFALKFLDAGQENDLFASTAARFLREYMLIDE
ncbi:uncharacterized protein N7479_001152 [Penicillium vulpinum]|uniref:uncharacterized protein n=1 Tax=Penicillium vulpinum TaxID=29845 RepID=UPI0025472B6D|nr:uncharacterized protein N7479_001152 [Penicillium vulpinum]KAJ5971234.1 hypothetical protein N7479_001152 [Penicillium vulpinum]